MLPLFRRKKEWLKWVLLLVIIALGFTTVLLFVNTPAGITSGIGVQDVAVVADQSITTAEFGRYYQRLLDTYRQLYKLDQQDPEIVKQLGIGQQALNQLIQQHAAGYAASQMGLSVAPAELISEISRLFQENGAFIGKERYRDILRANNLSTREFEDSMRRDILAEKLRKLLTDGIAATPDEVRQNFIETNQEVKVRYVTFDPEQIEKKEVSDEQLTTYYEEHLEEYRELERRKVSYVNVSVEPDTVEVTEEQIKRALRDVPADEQVRARHILIRVEEDEEAAEKKAQDLLKQVRGGADFDEVARENSADSASAARGGDLGFFGRGEMVPEFERVAFALEPGEIGELVQSPFGFHIIQTLEKTGGSEETRRPVAEFNARIQEADRQAKELADKMVSEIEQGASWEATAEKYSFEVMETPLFEQKSGVPGIGAGQDFADDVFRLAEGEITEPYSSGGRWVVARLDEVVAARTPPFEEVRERVATDFRTEQGNNLAREQAFDFFNVAEEAESFEDLAKDRGLSVTVTPFFRKNSTIDDNLKFSPEVHDQAFFLPEDGVGTPVLVTGKYFVFQVAEKSPIDEELFSVQKEQLSDQLTQRKRSDFFAAYIQNVMSDLRRQEKIVINQPLLDELVG